jgi:hypothetical protein
VFLVSSGETAVVGSPVVRALNVFAPHPFARGRGGVGILGPVGGSGSKAPSERGGVKGGARVAFPDGPELLPFHAHLHNIPV